MRVLIVHPSIIPVQLYGGTQRVIWGLGKELSRLGHEVTFLVKEGSYSDFANIQIIDPEKSLVSQIGDDFDIVHFNHQVKDLDQMTLPYILTMHGNAKSTEDLDANTVFVSSNHAQRHNATSFVYNGLDWSEYDEVNFSRPREYFHFLGKAAWTVKNVQGAIDTVKKTDKEHLKVLGGQRFNFKMGIRLTFSPRISFEGMVGGSQKNSFLNRSKGLIFPVIWHEPFGLALIESLYYGAPVFGTPYGALPEIIGTEQGFLSTSCSELALALNHWSEYDAQSLHDYALDQFNSRLMAEAYIKKYEKVLNGHTLNHKPPYRESETEERNLPWS